MRKLLLLALLAMASTLVFTGCGGGSTAAGGSADSDALAGRAVLTSDDMPGFTGSGGVGPCETGSHIWGGGGPTDVLACAMSSFLTNEAYSGEGRAQIDAQARADGYDPETLHAPGETPQPFTPIHGAFVSSHHGIFELYAPVTVLTSPEAAHDYFLQQADEARSWELGATEIPSSIGDESLTVKRPFGPDPTIFQTSFETVFRLGRVVVILNTMGSPDLSVEENWRLANLMDGRIQSGSGVYDTLPTLTPEPTDTPQPCADNRPSNGFLVRLPSDASLTPAINAPFLAESNPALSDLGLGALYVSDTDDSALLPQGAEVLSPLYMEASDPDLCTDDFRLDGMPAATAMRDAAIEYLTSTGTVSEAKLADGSSQWYVSDDSLPNGLIAVYTLLQTPSPFDGRDVVMTVFRGKDSPIAGAARVNLYASDPDNGTSCPPVMRFQSGYLIQVAPTAVADDPYLVGPLLASSTPALDDLGYGELQIETQPLKPDDKPLYLMAADPDLHTCDYQLSDKPVAKAMRDAAADYLIKTGTVSQDDLRKPSTVWMISDTDLPGGTIAVYTQLQNSPSASEQPGNRNVVMTVFQGKAGPIVGAAEVNLCPADSPNGAAFVAGSVVPCGGATDGQSAP